MIADTLEKVLKTQVGSIDRPYKEVKEMACPLGVMIEKKNGSEVLQWTLKYTKGRNPKLEIRNKFQCSKSQCPKFDRKVWNFGHLNFEFV